MVHRLDEILLLCLCAVISGSESFVDIAEYGEEKLDFLRTLAPFAHGISSHDTLSAVFRVLDPDEFGRAFATWVAGLSGQLDDTIVAIYGKTVRGSKAGGTSPLHLIPAWCDDLGLVLGQQASGHRTNEAKDTRCGRIGTSRTASTGCLT